MHGVIIMCPVWYWGITMKTRCADVLRIGCALYNFVARRTGERRLAPSTPQIYHCYRFHWAGNFTNAVQKWLRNEELKSKLIQLTISSLSLIPLKRKLFFFDILFQFLQGCHPFSTDFVEDFAARKSTPLCGIVFRSFRRKLLARRRWWCCDASPNGARRGRKATIYRDLGFGLVMMFRSAEKKTKTIESWRGTEIHNRVDWSIHWTFFCLYNSELFWLTSNFQHHI